MKMFLDIETIPCGEENREAFLNILKAKNKPPEGTDNEIYHKMSFDGTFGRICCIGYIKENGKTTKGVISGSEKDILTEFWNIARDTQLFIGHNILEFDFPFIYKRSIINRVKPRPDILFAKYRNSPIFDTMCEWEKWAPNRQKLSTLAKVLGLPTSKDEMDGSQVWDYYKNGRIDDICKYCLKDVELTRQIYYRMVFEEMPGKVGLIT